MVYLFLLSLLAVILVGYSLMGRIDSFIDNMGFCDDLRSESQQQILVYHPNHQKNSFLDRMVLEKITYQVIEEPHIPPGTHASILLALSDSDTDNLLLCVEAKHSEKGVYTIAICNNSIYKTIFVGAGINSLLNDDLSANSQLFEVLKWKTNK